MSQIKFDKPLQINLNPSLYYGLYIKVVHGLALAVLLLPFDISYLVRILLAIFIILSFFRTRKKLEQDYVGKLQLIDGSRWLWLVDKTNKQQLMFDSGAIITTKLVVLNFMTRAGKKVSWCFYPDSGDDELFRQLRIYLRYSTAETSSEIV